MAFLARHAGPLRAMKTVLLMFWHGVTLRAPPGHWQPGAASWYDVQRERPMPADPPNTPEPDDPPLTAAEAALLRRAATMPVDELDKLIRHVEQVRAQSAGAEEN